MSKAKVLELPDLTLAPERARNSIGVAASMPPEEVIRLVANTELRHLVQKNGLAFDSELALARIMIKRPRAFLDQPIGLILGPSEDPDKLPGLSVVSTVDEKKGKTLQQFENYMMALKGSKTIREQALVIADELYTNGAKNAWPAGSRAFRSTPERPGIVEFFARSDGTRLVFGCKDSYGEMGLNSVVSRIHSCYNKGVAQSISQGEGGAGIGSFMVFNSCLSYYAGVEKGRRTVVCVALPLGMGLREASELPKNIHLVSVA